MSNTNDAAARTIFIQRTFKVPVKQVWEAWTRAEHIAQWWGLKGTELKIVEHDFRVGGKWMYTMIMPNGGDFISDGVYSVIVYLEKIFTSANFKPMTEGVEIQALFEAKGESTDFTFHVIHPTKEYRDQQEQMGIYNGWGSAFNRLEAFVTKFQ